MADESPKRPNFFAGKLLSAEDLTGEQNYFINKSKRHNRFLHGFGIVDGLHVATNGGQIVVEPGLALDCEGNEILIPSSLVSAPLTAGETVYVNVTFKEEKVDFVPVPDADPQPANIKDSFILEFGPQNCNSKHRHALGRWLACGKLHPLTIAKLRKTSSGWRIDRRYRSPHVR